MSRVLVGFDETTENRGHTEPQTDMDFWNVSYTKAPSGQKSSMIFYRKDLTAKIMSRTHMLFLKLPKSPDGRTHAHTDIDF